MMKIKYIKFIACLLFFCIPMFCLSQPWEMMTMSGPHAYFGNWLKGNTDTINVWQEESPYNQAFVDEWIFEGLSAGGITDNTFLDSHSYLSYSTEFNMGSKLYALQPFTRFTTNHSDSATARNRFDSTNIMCGGGFLFKADRHYVNSAIEFMYDCSRGDDYANSSSAWIPTMAYAYYRIADEKYSSGWTQFDIRAALRKSATNYPNYGYGKSTYDIDRRVDGYGMPNLQLALAYELDDLPIFAPFINSVTISLADITIKGMDWDSSLLDESVIVLFENMPADDAVPVDGLAILWQGKFFNESDETILIPLTNIPEAYLINNAVYYLGAFSKHTDGSYTPMTVYQYEDGSTFNLNAYEIQLPLLYNNKYWTVGGKRLKTANGKFIRF